MDRLNLLAPALVLLGVFVVAFAVYCGLHVLGRAPAIEGVKHNQIFGPFVARFIVWLLSPVERLLVGRVSPNAVTACSLAACVGTGIAAGTHHLGTAVWLFMLAGILDILDGRLARLAGRQTASGALFDSVSDRWGELVAFVGYAWCLHDSPWMLAVLGATGASTMVSYTRARAEGLGLELSGGMMQRAERMVLVSAGTLLAAWYGADPTTAFAVTPILGITMAVCAVTSAATAIGRWVIAYRELARREAAEAMVVVEEPALPVSAQPPPRLPSLVGAKVSTTDLRKVLPQH
jgi:phosphatidylglycerophosphate synthase